MSDLSLFEAARMLLDHNGYLILIHEHSDGDAVGSAEALRSALTRLGKRASVFSPDLCVPDNLAPFLRAPLIRDPEGRYTCISVDVAENALFGEYADFFRGRVLLKLDHHRVGEDFARHNYTDPDAAAAGEIVWELTDLLGVMDKEIAESLYVAIASDTGCFRYSNTTAKTLRVAANLYEAGIDAALLNVRLFESRELNAVSALAVGIEHTRFFLNGAVALCTVTNELRREHGFTDENFSELSSTLRSIDGVELAVVLRQEQNEARKFRLSTRSKSFFDCADFCLRFEGGGHLRAAGGGVWADSAKEAEEQVLRVIEELWKK